MIYTSYFAKAGKIKGGNLISIARKTPDVFIGRQYLKLAPSWDILMQYKRLTCIGREKLYTERFYNEILAELNPDKVVFELGENPVLLCYEKPTDFCHRFIVAEWLIRNGYEVQEYKF